MSYRLIDANALNGVISNDDYGKVLNAPCIFADLPNGLDGEHYNLQEPQTGHWIKTISENGITSAVRCSECGFEDNRYMLFRYCPNCGTKMIEPNMSENPIDSKDVIWYSKRNYSEIVVEPQERSDKE